MPQLLSRKTVTARTWHACQTCGARAIAPGDEYVREALVHDGRAYTWVQCAACGDIAAEVWEWCWAPDEGVDRDDYYAWATETLNDAEWGSQAAAYLLRLEANRGR